MFKQKLVLSLLYIVFVNEKINILKSRILQELIFINEQIEFILR